MPPTVPWMPIGRVRVHILPVFKAINEAGLRPPEGGCHPHRFGSFAPSRGLIEDESQAQWFVDGQAAFQYRMVAVPRTNVMGLVLVVVIRALEWAGYREIHFAADKLAKKVLRNGQNCTYELEFLSGL
ncbi:hypothetical protein C5167_012758 [Papaver somniferum]|uniref:Uncharacterized protein n=1 Tax=Papaver somniferum TaxID=3469 RepID=A0A4Y7J1U3_PAPSO|nr:hypothetical protein C5167_012758 [Papaver somniferum]